MNDEKLILKPSSNDTITRIDVILSGILTCIQNLEQLVDKYDIKSPIHNGGLNYSKSEKNKIIKELLNIFSNVKYIEYLNKKMKTIEKIKKNFPTDFIAISQKEEDELNESILKEIKKLNKNKIIYQEFYVLIIRRLRLLAEEI